MNWLPILILLFFAKNFTSRKKGLGSENLLSFLKLAATVKESGVWDLFKGGEPLSNILSGNFPVEKLLNLVSAFTADDPEKQEENAPNPSILNELSGEEMGCVLTDLLNEKHLVTE